jgi:cellulose biosynthesis protein BcsQ
VAVVITLAQRNGGTGKTMVAANRAARLAEIVGVLR